MKNLRSSLTQFRTGGRLMGLIFVVSALLLGTGLLLHYGAGVPFGELTRDPVAIAGDPPYTGFLSQIGIFGWAAAAAVCLFSAQAVSGVSPRQSREFLVVSGMLTLALGLDDVFLIHEVLFPHFGILQNIILFVYAGVFVLYLVRFYSVILKTEYIVLGMAFAFFALSASLDWLHPHGIDPYLWEDGAKLVGIISWLVYFFRTGTDVIHQNAA